MLSLSDWIGLIGILVSLIGFGGTIIQIWRAKSAADSATHAANAALDGVRRLDTLVEIASISKSLDDIKEAIRTDNHERLPNLFDRARKSLIMARENHPNLSDKDRNSIQRTLSFFTKTEVGVAEHGLQYITERKAKLTSTMIEISDSNFSLLTHSRLPEQDNA